MKDAVGKIEQEKSDQKQQLWQQLMPFIGDSNDSSIYCQTRMILVLEDNLDTSGSFAQSTLDALFAFTSMPDISWDVIHLSYIPYVPNLLVSKTSDSSIVKLSTGVGSALGTTAYIINENGMKSLIREDEKRGYYAAIPNVMALKFPDSRYAPYPVPFLRAAKVPSLVNPQLDDLRSILFQPGVVSSVQLLLTQTGLSSNNLLFATIVLCWMCLESLGKLHSM